MIKYLFLATAFLLEISSLEYLFRTQSGDDLLAWCLLLHGAGSALQAAFIWPFVPQTFRQPKLPMLALLFNFAFFMPLIGLLGVVIAFMIANFRRRAVLRHPFASLPLPEYVLNMRETDHQFSQGGIKSRLAQTSIPTPKRLQSLLALQGMPARVSSPLLQDMLGDSSDDIRLVAYGLLDSREKTITAQIHQELDKLRKASSNELRLICLRQLAELYWELVYAGLAQGDLRTHSLKQALSYIDSATQLGGEDSGLLFLKGRILYELKQADEALHFMQQAVAYGLPESRVLPYITQIAFDQHDFPKVRELLGRISTDQVTPFMRSIINFWVETQPTPPPAETDGKRALI